MGSVRRPTPPGTSIGGRGTSPTLPGVSPRPLHAPAGCAPGLLVAGSTCTTDVSWAKELFARRAVSSRRPSSLLPLAVSLGVAMLSLGAHGGAGLGAAEQPWQDGEWTGRGGSELAAPGELMSLLCLLRLAPLWGPTARAALARAPTANAWPARTEGSLCDAERDGGANGERSTHVGGRLFPPPPPVRPCAARCCSIPSTLMHQWPSKPCAGLAGPPSTSSRRVLKCSACRAAPQAGGPTPACAVLHAREAAGCERWTRRVAARRSTRAERRTEL